MVGRSSCNLQKITEGPQENGSRWAERKADMILTVTLNPAVDKTYRTGELFPGRVNRMRSVDNIPGGKGINVSKILRQYDYEVTATGFLGGYQGKWMEAQLDRLKIRSAFVHVEEETRSSMNIVADNGYVTEILEPGPHISEAHLKEFGASFIRLAEESSLIILSGSAAPGISADIYARLIRSAAAMGKKVILDTSGELLKEGIQAAPAVVKPNRKELEYIIGRRLQDREDVKDAANVLLASGIRMVMISLGGQGSDTGKGGTLPLRQGAQGYRDEHGGLRGQRGSFPGHVHDSWHRGRRTAAKSGGCFRGQCDHVGKRECASEAGGGNDEGY